MLFSGRRNDWCFLCELQTHLERASNNFSPFSPVSILSRLPHIGGNLGYGRQEDAHEFMRFPNTTTRFIIYFLLKNYWISTVLFVAQLHVLLHFSENSFLFCRFAIDTMQSVCLDEFGGEKAVHPSSQETTLIQHIFGGQLQSRVLSHAVLDSWTKTRNFP